MTAIKSEHVLVTIVIDDPRTQEKLVIRLSDVYFNAYSHDGRSMSIAMDGIVDADEPEV